MTTKKDYSKTIKWYNGNGQKMTKTIPDLFIEKFGNEGARKHFEKQTGLKLKDYFGGYIAKPKTFKQLYKVFTCYNWVTTYYDNCNFRNTLKLSHKPYNPQAKTFN